MVTATPKKGRSKLVQKSAVEQVSSLLQELPKKEKQELPLGEAIAEAAEIIQAALAKGYGYKELADILSAQLGVSISVWSLKRYLSAATKGEAASKTAPKVKRGRKAKATSPAAAPAVAQAIETPAVAIVAVPEASGEAEVSAPDPVVDAPATPKKRGTRTASARSAQSKTTAEAAPAKKRGTRTRAATAAQPEAGAKTTTRKPRAGASQEKSTASRGRKKAV